MLLSESPYVWVTFNVRILPLLMKADMQISIKDYRRKS